MKRSIRICAIFMALILVIVPPLQAQAAAVTGTGVLIGLGAAAVVGSVMIGLGVMPGSDRSAFNTIVQSCTESASVGAYIVDGLIDVLRYINSGGVIRYGVLQNLIEAVCGWLFDEEIVIHPSYNTSAVNVTFNGTNYLCGFSVPFINVLVVLHNSSGQIAPALFSVLPSYVSNSTKINDFYVYRHISSSFSNGYNLSTFYGHQITLHSYFDNFFDIFYDYSLSDFLSASTSFDLTLGSIPSPSDDLTSSYADWSAGSIALPHPGIDIPGVDTPGTGEDTGEGEEGEEGEETDDPPLIYWPTGIINPSTDTTDVLTQENIMAGTGTLDDTLTGEITGPIVGGITGDITVDTTIPGEGTGEGEGTQEGVGEGEGEVVYPTDIPSYTMDLTDIFPFCIPFDIYEFLSILAADPEAPVFHWKIPVPQLGIDYDLEVDLSPWNEVAKLFRTLELLGFIVGLAMVTRDKFIRS